MKMLFLICFLTATCFADIQVGVGKANITPPAGTHSAGYAKRIQPMEGVHDPLQAISLFIDNGQKKIVLCSVDNLGLPYSICQKIQEKVHSQPDCAEIEIYIGSSHTHSGGGGYLDIPVIGEKLAGKYDAALTQFYINTTAEAIIQSIQNPKPALVGIGYGQAEAISCYRASWPLNVTPSRQVTILKITHLDGSPMAVFFDLPIHPTVLPHDNLQFSADFVGYARQDLSSALCGAEAIFFNGAQGDINPVILNSEDRFEACSQLGKSISNTVLETWKCTNTSSKLTITTQKEAYTFAPQATPFGLKLPLETYPTEMNAIIFNKSHAFITIPGELSTLYHQKLQAQFGCHITILGLTNDAHGYIITPEAWQHKTAESGLSFGGEYYGDEVYERVRKLL